MEALEAAEILKTDSCYECAYGCYEGAATCENEKCQVRQATIMAIKALEEKDGKSNAEF